jgi:hypothetical protein
MQFSPNESKGSRVGALSNASRAGEGSHPDRPRTQGSNLGRWNRKLISSFEPFATIAQHTHEQQRVGTLKYL